MAWVERLLVLTPGGPARWEGNDKVLLTRGLRGVWLHSTDPETQRFLERLVH